MKEKKTRMEDALSATRAAVEEGITPGGGIALVRATGALDGLELSGDQLTGARTVQRALEQPLLLIARNSGFPGEVVLDTAKNSQADWGFDAEAGEWGHMLERGITDPAKVIRSALENAASVAAMVLTTESLITDIPEKEKEQGVGAEAGMGAMPGMM